jgi:hypothetical protein
MWNGPINGNYSNCIWTLPPWTSGVAELTNEEVLFVIETCKPLEEQSSDLLYVVGKYNESTNYKKAINGDTYAVIKGYDPEIHSLGIDANGIVIPNDPPTSDEVSQPVEENTGDVEPVEEVTEEGEE